MATDEPALPPVETFFSFPDLAQPVLSPSGRYVAMLLLGSGKTKTNTLAVTDLTEPRNTKSIARFANADISGIRWVGDDRLVFGTAAMRGLYSIRRDGSKVLELIDRNGLAVDGSIRSGSHVLSYANWAFDVLRNSQTEIVVGQLRLDGSGDVQSASPVRIEVDSGRLRYFGNRLPPFTTRWLFDRAGELRVAVVVRDNRRQVHWRNPGEEGWKQLDESPLLDEPWSPYAVDGAGTLYVIAPIGKAGTSVLTHFDFATGRPHPEPLVSTPGFDFLGLLVSDPASGSRLGVRAFVGTEVTVWSDPGMKAAQAEVDRQLPGRVNRLACSPCGNDDRVLLINSYADRDPGSYWVLRAGAKSVELLGRAYKGIDPQRMASIDFQRIRARDGRDLPVWVTLPHGALADGKRPAVVMIHGGPWARGGSWEWDAMAQFLASRGYVVIEPEFRGSTGYGQEHFRAGWRQWGQAMQDDVADAVLWAAGEKLIDPARVCIAGASYGGYATLMGLVRHPELYRCGAAWLAVTDPMRLLESSWIWIDDIDEQARRYGMPVLVGDPKADAEMLKANAPVHQAARIRAPVLLAYGAEDRRVPLVHGHEMREALRRQGREPEWIVYNDEGHGWRQIETRRDFALKLEAFFAKHLK